MSTPSGPLTGLTFGCAGAPRRAHALVVGLLQELGACEGPNPALGIGGEVAPAWLEVTGPVDEGEAASAAGLWVPPLSRRPRPMQLEVASWIAALQAVNTTLALVAAGRPGRVTVPVVGAALHAHELTFLFTDAPPPDQEPLRMAASPWIGAYPTADGWIFLHAGQPAHRAALVALLGDPGSSAETCADPTRVGSVVEALRTRRWLAAAFRRRTAAAWEDALGAQLCVVRVRSPGEWEPEPATWSAGAPLPWVASGALPLGGLRVFDWTQVIAGPVAARALAELGADVLRLDNPRLHVGWSEAFHAAFNGGKRLLTADVTSESVAEVLVQFDPHVVVEGLRAGVAARLAVLPPGNRIVSRVSAYGSGKWAGRPGWEQTAQAVAGWLTAYGGRRPALVPLPVNDLLTGLICAFRAIAAVWSRQGARMETSLVETALRLSGPVAFPRHATAPARALRESGLRRRVQVAGRTWTLVASPVQIDGTPLPELSPAAPRALVEPSTKRRSQLPWLAPILAARLD